MGALWRGTWATRLRIATGLVLFVYAGLHFLNIGLGLVSHDVMHAAQDARLVVTRSLPGSVLLYTALVVHAALGLWRVATRGVMPVTAMGRLQVALGLAIPLLLLPHLIYTRFAHEVYALDDRMALLTFLLWDTRDGWLQSLLLLIVWVHGCIGLHLWLRGQRWWRRALPVLSALAALVPAFALAGFLTEGRLMKDVLRDATTRAAFRADVNWPDGPVWGALLALRQDATWIFLVLLGLVAAVHLGRRLIARRALVPIRYRYGPAIRGRKGLTLLEMSRAAGVPHTSLCGGKGRCTTCRVVIEEGGETLPPPGPAEARSLDGLGGPPGTRLACMIRPEAPLAVYRVFRPDGRRARAHASQGEERTLAILFLDMRGFTGRTTGQLPYDVVFLLNRFFDAIVPAIVAAGGTVDKYLGDGLLAVFEARDAGASARAALAATQGIGEALDAFNEELAREGSEPVRIGAGLHAGEVVMGEIGASGNAPRTIIGDTVNTASRLEARTKELGVEILVSASLIAAAGHDTGTLDLVALDLRGVRGTIHALPVKRACGLRAALDTPGAASRATA